MQFLKFVAYVFEYQGGKKFENSGYAKVEFQQERIKMILQLRLPGIVNERMKIHLFTEKNGQMLGFLAGEGKLKWNALQMQILIGKDKLEEYQLSFRDLKGIYIVSESGQEFISEWEDHSFPGREFRLLEPKMIRKEVKPTIETEQAAAEIETEAKEIVDQRDRFDQLKEAGSENLTDNEEAGALETQTSKAVEKGEQDIEANDMRTGAFSAHAHNAEETLQEQAETKIEAALENEAQAIDGNIHEEQAILTMTETEAPVSESDESQQTAAGLEETKEISDSNMQWDTTNSEVKTARVEATVSQQEVNANKGRQSDFVKIDLRALRQLPRKEWHLASNRFLLHGFYNYRYLCMRQEDDHTIVLGVPGVYYVREKAAASTFGFAYFECQHTKQPAEGEFGFWCRKISV